MYHPTYAWLFFGWYPKNWWSVNTSCTIENSIPPENLERIVRTSLAFDHSPTIEDEDKDKLNQGNIVSIANINYVCSLRHFLN